MRFVLTLSIAAMLAAPAVALAANNPDLTIYRGNNDALFQASGATSMNAGHAVVHEQRQLHLDSGTHDVTISNLPDFLDPEAVNLSFDTSSATVRSQRLLLPHGKHGSLSGHIGKTVMVTGDNGQKLAQGKLVQVNRDGSLVLGGDVFGPTIINDYAAVTLRDGQIGGGSRLQVRVDADTSGSAHARLTYPTSGLAWRGAYTGIMASGSGCKLQLKSMASVANRSGRDWTNADIKLVAGQPSFAKSNGGGPRRMRAMVASASKASPETQRPRQSTLEDYRTYTLPGEVSLPGSSVTLTPLYDDKTVSCQRTWLFENGRALHRARPDTRDHGGHETHGRVSSALTFTAFDSFPAGYLRVLTRDDDGQTEFLGEGRVTDTPKGQDINMTLGTAFDLTGTRKRTKFHVNKAARTMDAGFRITLNNAGDTARTITVREHPSRWRNWKVTSSSIDPDKKTPDVLEFRVDVPAGGTRKLDYTVRYSWTAQDER